MTADLKTRCPHCQTAFRVSTSQLEAARGMVRCGQCFRAFNARQRLFGESDATAAAAASEDDGDRPQRRSARPLGDDDFYIDDNFDLSRLEEQGEPPQPTRPPADDDLYIDDDFDLSQLDRLTGAAPARPRESADTDAGGQAGETAPESATTEQEQPSGKTGTDEAPPSGDEAATPTRDSGGVDPLTMADWRSPSDDIIDAGEQTRARVEGNPPTNRPHWAWYPASLVALLLLGLQLVYFNSRQIEPDAPLRPVAETLCSVLDCPLPSRHGPHSVVTRDLVIRTHPSADNALLVDAVLINRGDNPRPFPPLRLRFEDLQGRPVAQRTFAPAEYLREALAQRPMPPGQPVKLELELADPGEEAVSFRLDVAE